MRAKHRSSAHFDVTYRSSVLKTTVTWKITLDEVGLQARRDHDGRRVAIPWERMIALAMFYGFDQGRNNGK